MRAPPLAPHARPTLHGFDETGLQRRRRRRTMLGVAHAVFGRGERIKRAFDILAGVGTCIVLVPIALIISAALVVAAPGAPLIVRAERIGGAGRRFFELRFRLLPGRAGVAMAALRLQHLPLLLNVVRGDLSIVGPRRVSPSEIIPGDSSAWRRTETRPGLVSLWTLREQANVGFDGERATTAEYLDGQSMAGDVGILVRAAFGGMFAARPREFADRVHILGMRIDNLTMSGAVDRIAAAAATPRRMMRVCFVNADCANVATRLASYRGVLRTADLLLADGIGMKLAGRALRSPIRENVNGTDLFPRLCKRLATDGRRVFLFGGRPGVAHDVKAWIEHNHPGLTVVGARHGYLSGSDDADVVADIAASRADVLLVALGAPHQELWIARHGDALRVRVAIGVGGLFDFMAGRVPRAPQWLRELGGEWLFRLYQEPRRMWRRYVVGNVVFLARVLRDRARGAVQSPNSNGSES